MKQLPNARLYSASSLLAMILMLGGCGGGSSSSEAEQDSSLVSRGVITGFGSVYVNGVRFATGGTQFSVDDDVGAESDLRVGMVVTVHGSIDDNGGNGNASRIVYDNELKGPVTAITADASDASIKTLTILGQAVEVNSNTTFDDDDGLTFANLLVGDVLEISGFVSAAGLTATHIEKQDNDLEIEIKGRIANLTASSFEINEFPISYDANTELDDIALLVEAMFVEVEGRLNGSGSILLADEIEAEHEGLGDDMDEAEIEGIIYDYNAAARSFRIQGQLIDASFAELYPSSLQLADGLMVEAEGNVVNGVLVADEIEQKGKKIKIQAYLSAVNADSVLFNFNATDIQARVNHQTELEDDITDTDIQLSQLSIGDFVEMEAFDDGSGVINAVEIERKLANEVRLSAAVEAWDASGQSVVLLGVNFDLSAAGYEDDDDQVISASEFYAALQPGVFVKIKDTDSNGVFDNAELDD